MFSSKSFIVSGLAFRSLVHFEFIFVYGVRECSNFILLHVAVQKIWNASQICMSSLYRGHANLLYLSYFSICAKIGSEHSWVILIGNALYL